MLVAVIPVEEQLLCEVGQHTDDCLGDHLKNRVQVNNYGISTSDDLSQFKAFVER